MSEPVRTETPALVAAAGLRVEFGGGARRVRVLDGIDLAIGRGEIVALVGESGCGKSTLGRAFLRLNRAAAGKILFDGADITGWSPRRLRPLRRRMHMIFQHPAAALNPRMLVGAAVTEPLRAMGRSRADRDRAAAEMLQRVGLSGQFLVRYPHELSGGQLQRVGIARALIGRPDFVVADEPLSSLDLSVQAQVMVVLKALQAELRISLLFITHDLAAAEYMGNRVAVMYLGKIVEIAPSRNFSKRAKHPYAHALIDAVPHMDPAAERSRAIKPLEGEVPSLLKLPRGCRFSSRCPLAQERCRREEPPLRKTNDDHDVACWLV